MREVPIRKTHLWQMVIDNIEQMHPRYLVSLVEDKTLDSVVQQRIRAYATLLLKLKEKMPGATNWEIEEIAQAEHLTPVNPNWQDEKPLNREEKRKLKEYLRSLKQEQGSQ